MIRPEPVAREGQADRVVLADRVADPAVRLVPEDQADRVAVLVVLVDRVVDPVVRVVPEDPAGPRDDENRTRSIGFEYDTTRFVV